MNEIEKLYKNVGIEKVIKKYCSYDYGVTCPHNASDCSECQYYADTEPQYPDFTAEKQLELIKWLSQHTYRNYIKFRFDICGLWYCECNMSNSDMHHTFEDALIDVLIQIWQDLTTEEKQQIKEILG